MPKPLPKFIPPAPVNMQYPIERKLLLQYETFDNWVLDFLDSVIVLEESPSEKARLDKLFEQMQLQPEPTKRARAHWDSEQANAKVSK